MARVSCRSWLWLAALLTGCPYVFHPDLPGASTEASNLSGNPPDTEGAVLGVLELSAVLPAYGPTAGGTEVTLHGTFPDDVVVSFDGVAGAPVSRTGTRLTVASPLHPVSGWVDVTVSSAIGNLVAHEAFQYWPDATGWTSLIGTLVYEDFVTGEHIDVHGLEARAYGGIGFVHPADWAYTDSFSPVMGDCRRDYEPPGAHRYYETGASEVLLANGSTVVRIPVVSGGYFDGDFAADVQVQPGETYDLLPLDSPAFPHFELPALLTVPAPFEVTTPRMAQQRAPLVDKDILIRWTGAGRGDGIVLIATWFGWLDDASWEDDVITCVVPDTGEFLLDADVWPTPLRSEAVLHLQVARYEKSPMSLPHDNGDSAVVGINVVYGLVEVR